jgi:hypothetical protein
MKRPLPLSRVNESLFDKVLGSRWILVKSIPADQKFRSQLFPGEILAPAVNAKARRRRVSIGRLAGFRVFPLSNPTPPR